MLVPNYPHCIPISLALRSVLHPIFCTLGHGISECTFSNLFLFRRKYHYEVTRLSNGHYAIHGKQAGVEFWIFPQGLPPHAVLRKVCDGTQIIKCIPKEEVPQAQKYATEYGYRLFEDRDNFDYLYHRSDLAGLRGRKFHKKRNLIHNFRNNHVHQLRPLGSAEIPDALKILDAWHAVHAEDNDYAANKDALHTMAELQLCGYIVYSNSVPIACALGEGIARHRIFVIHFEKAMAQYTGIYQYINMAFAAALPKHYEYINREQDMGDEGMRQAKMTYRPAQFVEKYRLLPQRLDTERADAEKIT